MWRNFVRSPEECLSLLFWWNVVLSLALAFTVGLKCG